MNAWTIYWVMQLDSIGGALTFLGFAASIGASVAGIWAVVCSCDHPDNWVSDRSKAEATRALKRAPGLISASKKLAAAAITLILISAALPSSKTAATMVILPAIANNEAIKKEAGDLYGLAKQALINLAKPDEKSK